MTSSSVYEQEAATEKLTLPSEPSCRLEDFQRSLIGDIEEAAALRCIRWARENRKAFDRYGGIEVDAYELEFAKYVGTNYATSTSSGTAAIHSGLASLDLKPGDEVICPPITDVGGITPVLFNLCIPVFADTQPWSFNISPDGIERVLSPRTRAIMVAHIAGEACEMDPIMEIARARNLPVLEDAAQAHGATYHGKSCGSIGTIGIFSMMSGKHHTSGGQGGMVVTNDKETALRAKAFADRGKFFLATGVENRMAGLNYRMTELEASIGRVQLLRLNDFLYVRRKNALLLNELLAESRLFSLGRVPEESESSYWFLRVRLNLDLISADKEEVVRALNAEGILSAPTYTSIIYQQPWLRQRNIFARSGIPWSLAPKGIVYNYENSCPNAERALANHILIAFNESLSQDAMVRIAQAMLRVESRYC